MSILKRFICVFMFAIFSTSFMATAGSQQSAPPQHDPNHIIQFAKQVEHYAANKRARAFIIARLGQPEKELPKGIKFTHTAIAVYSQVTLSDGTSAYGYAIHNLYQNDDNPDRSQLVVDYPVDFFWGAQELKAGILIPSETVQTRLIEAINQGYFASLHNNKYSLISNPNNNKYQNCTEHTLNVINAAIYQTDDMDAIKTAIKNHFTPQRLSVSPLKLALGNWFVEGVKTSDHGRKKYVTTFMSIANFLDQNQLMDSLTVLHFEQEQG